MLAYVASANVLELFLLSSSPWTIIGGGFRRNNFKNDVDDYRISIIDILGGVD